MIEIFDKLFKLNTKDTSYVFAITDEGHLEHVYYGKRIPDTDLEALCLKNTIVLGTTVDYSGDNVGYSLDTEPLFTHTYPLAKIDEVYELFENKRDGVIKVAVEC